MSRVTNFADSNIFQFLQWGKLGAWKMEKIFKRKENWLTELLFIRWQTKGHFYIAVWWQSSTFERYMAHKLHCQFHLPQPAKWSFLHWNQACLIHMIEGKMDRADK